MSDSPSAAGYATSRPVGSRLIAAAGILAVLVLAFAVYLPGLPGDYVYDDHRLIRDNAGLRRPVDVRRAFLRDYYAFDLDRMGLGYYRPVTILSNELDYRRGGGAPAAFHHTNMAVHALCAALVVLLGLRLFGKATPAIGAGVLFALHPAHAESVAFISGRVDPLATMFSLVAVLAHLAANRSRHAAAWRVIVGFSWLLALGSKEMAITVPVLVVLLEIAEEGWASTRDIATRAARYVPYVVALAIYLAARVNAFGGLLAGSDGETTFSAWRVVVVLGSYAAWLVMPPVGLHLEPPPVEGVLAAGAALALLGAIVAVGLMAWRGRRTAAALAAWTLISLLPVAQVITLETVLSDRFLYLPSVASCLVLGWLALSLPRTRARRIAAGLAITVLAAAYLAVLESRVVLWRDEVALWEAKLDEEPDSLKGTLNLARAQARRGSPVASRQAYESALRLAPGLEPTIRAEMLGLAGGQGDAEDAIREAIQAHPADASLRNNLGLVLLEKGDAVGAAGAFEDCIARTPLRDSCWIGRALASAHLRDWEGVYLAGERAFEINPDLGLARALQAEAALKLGRPCEAVELSSGIALQDPAENAMLERIATIAREQCPR